MEASSPTARQRTSALAAFGFFCGLASAALAAVATAMVYAVDFGNVLQIGPEERHQVLQAARILFFCTTAPALGAAAFWLGARSVVRASEGGLRGVGLYRAGLAFALLSCMAAFGGRGAPGARAADGLRDPDDGRRGSVAAWSFVRIQSTDVPVDHPGWWTAPDFEVKLPAVVYDPVIRQRVEDRLRSEWPGPPIAEQEILNHVTLRRAWGAGTQVRIEARAPSRALAALLANAFAEEWVRRVQEDTLALARDRRLAIERELGAVQDEGRRRSLQEEARKCADYVDNPSGPLAVHRKAWIESVEKER